MFHVIKSDALDWLKKNPITNVVTGVCDLDEIIPPMSVASYVDYVYDIYDTILGKLPDGCYAIFIQTDRKIKGELLSKAFMAMMMAAKHDVPLLWHKVVCHRDPGKTDLHRPGFANMLCFGKARPGSATPDVIPVSPRAYRNGTPEAAAQLAVSFIERYSKIKHIIDPFAGLCQIAKTCLEHNIDCVNIDLK